jgi:hypothetical protein
MTANHAARDLICSLGQFGFRHERAATPFAAGAAEISGLYAMLTMVGAVDH